MHRRGLLAHGHTETSSTQDVSFDAQAATLAQLLDALDVGQVDLVSNDSGTGIDQELRRHRKPLP